MTVQVTGQPITEYASLTDNTATVIFTASKRTTIVYIGCTETNGGTQELSVFVSRAGGDHYLRKELAVSAGQRVVFDEVFTLNQGDVLKAQSGDIGGYFDIMTTYLSPDAQAVR